MKKQILISMALLIIVSNMANAQTNSQRAESEKAIRQVIKNVEEGWAAGDAVKFADQYADDVDYTVWNGIQISGRDENIKGHQEIFDTFYKGTNVQFEILKLRFLADDVAAVHLRGKMYKKGERVEDVPTVLPLMVFKKLSGKWKIIIFQNTPIINRGELVIGRTGGNAEN